MLIVTLPAIPEVNKPRACDNWMRDSPNFDGMPGPRSVFRVAVALKNDSVRGIDDSDEAMITSHLERSR